MTESAILVLADGTVFEGVSIGAVGVAVGELVFNTSMSGYQEILSDPSYAEQIVTLTYPHIGNVGCNRIDAENSKAWARGLVVRDASLVTSNYRAELSLSDWLKQQGIVAIAECDTRHLTHLLRNNGAQGACIMAGEHDVERALSAATSFAGLAGRDLAKEVCRQDVTSWQEGRGEWGHEPEACRFHVVAYDFGVKHNILKILSDKGCRITLVPATTPAAEVLKMKPDGVFLSNGPGDPLACDYAQQAIQELLREKIPLFGICLGFQLLALACGAKSFKMKLGHHGGNHPVLDVESKRVHITSQNHGFAIDETSLPPFLSVTHRSLFDDSLQGIRHSGQPAFGFQGHPEASPGPHDIISLFDEFISSMTEGE